MNEPTYIDCECYDQDHAIRFWADTDDPGFETMIIEMKLKHWRSWYKRLWVGIKYIFGISGCKYGHFCCSSLDINRVKTLKKLLTSFEVEVELNSWQKKK